MAYIICNTCKKVETCKMGSKRHKIINSRVMVMGTWWYQCAMCGNWSNNTELYEKYPQLHENTWDVVNVDQMMGYGCFSTITINNVTKPFVCHQCWLNEMGTIE